MKTCSECDGTGEISASESCMTCAGTGEMRHALVKGGIYAHRWNPRELENMGSSNILDSTAIPIPEPHGGGSVGLRHNLVPPWPRTPREAVSRGWITWGDFYDHYQEDPSSWWWNVEVEYRPNAPRRADEPLLVVRRVDRHTARIYDQEGHPYSELMRISDATDLLKEVLKKPITVVGKERAERTRV